MRKFYTIILIILISSTSKSDEMNALYNQHEKVETVALLKNDLQMHQDNQNKNVLLAAYLKNSLPRDLAKKLTIKKITETIFCNLRVGSEISVAVTKTGNLYSNVGYEYQDIYKYLNSTGYINIIDMGYYPNMVNLLKKYKINITPKGIKRFGDSKIDWVEPAGFGSKYKAVSIGIPICKKKFISITGIRDDGDNKVVEFTFKYDEPSEFYNYIPDNYLINYPIDKILSDQIYFIYYDDGWRAFTNNEYLKLKYG